MVFGLFKKPNKPEAGSWNKKIDSEGLVIIYGEGTEGVFESPYLSGYLAQLIDDGLASTIDNKSFRILWSNFYVALAAPGYSELTQILELPEFTRAQMRLRSSNSLIDKNFAISIDGWQFQGKTQYPDNTGALLNVGDCPALMKAAQWELFCEVLKFSAREDSERNELNHRQQWGRIRQLATRAEAKLDDFLHRTIVLTPDRLDLKIRKSTFVSDDNVIEIEPLFDGAPQDWIARFDKANSVLDRYDVITENGIVQILITDEVKAVLQEIKRLPGRRVAGSRAQALLTNPFAALGPSAKNVIDEDQFEEARASAGIQFERFTPVIERDFGGHPIRIGLLIEAADSNGPSHSGNEWLSIDELKRFTSKLAHALANGYQLLAWNGYDFELSADSTRHLEELKAATLEISKPQSLVSYAQVHDLSGYSSRIEGIGIEKPYYSPYIAKKSEDDGWFPENVIPIIAYTPDGETEQVAVPLTKDALNKLEAEITKAEEAGQSEINLPWLPKPIPVAEAKAITGTFKEVEKEVKKDGFDPKKMSSTVNSLAKTKKTLILRANIQEVEYEEKRRDALLNVPNTPTLPNSLNQGYKLLPHQLEGLAWLQHLYGAQKEFQVRGAVLADDMGLGKTFQLLSFMAWLVENNPTIDPMLVVAPVSLLENWKEEAGKFLREGSLSILTAYGDSLGPLRVPREAIESRLLAEDGLVRFLKPNWIGSAKVVLTTYETLRDLEFSFAAQHWTVMVCDEAQRIKNPAAMVTRAAKKQNVDFKIACTGTPVENTLADLWCLFDFIQPGLLGALNDFGKRYRKPIEAKNDEEKLRVEELRQKIAPQILRRTKAEVAKDLPAKIIVEECRKLQISTIQRNLYAKAIDDFKKRNEPNAAVPFKNHLGLLQYLRLICTDPRRHGVAVFKPEPIEDYRAKAPKLDWLIRELSNIRNKQEKVIVFCEFRNIQRLLQHYIEQSFGIKVDIINGDTSAAASNADSRQKRIKAFQATNGFGVIVLSPVAVGFGVNIQAANHVIHYTRTWNPAKEDQATDRAYRIGQTKDVYVYYPVIHADDFSTFDVKLDQLLSTKRGLASDMLNGSGDLSPADFNIADVVPGDYATDFEENVDIQLALQLSWRHFEGLAAALWLKQGYDMVYCTPSSNDQGVDVVAISGTDGVLIQTKTSGNEGAKLGWEIVKELVGGEAYYKRRHSNVNFKKVGLTNQYFNSQANEHASLNSVTLVDQTGLDALLKRYRVTLMDIEKILYTDWSTVESDSNLSND